MLGVDTIAQFETPASLPVFLSHELFHRYHFQAAGFSDDLAERDLIWRSLWAEGLATYVSARLNPSNPLSDALIVPRRTSRRAPSRWSPRWRRASRPRTGSTRGLRKFFEKAARVPKPSASDGRRAPATTSAIWSRRTSAAGAAWPSSRT